MATILDLPNEILDKVFSYVAWSPAESLIPSYPDITSISLSCRHLRGAVLPTLFRNVRLKLRWVDGAIAVPGLYQLRREAPHLAKHVRCVHIETQFGQNQARNLELFTISTALDGWETFSPTDDASTELELKHRMRIRQIAAELYGVLAPARSPTELPSETDSIVRAFFGTIESDRHQPVENSEAGPRQASLGDQASQYPGAAGQVDLSTDDTLIAAREGSRKRRLQLDALITCMLSIPPQTQSLIFEACPVGLHDQLQHTFALQICAMALRIFGLRLQSLAMIARSLGKTTRLPGLDTSTQSSDYDVVLTPVVVELQSITSFTLASTGSSSDQVGKHNLDKIRAGLWQAEPLTSSITHLSLHKIVDTRSKLFDFIKSFTSLTRLSISDVKMGGFQQGIITLGQSNAPDSHIWLLFLISVRLHRPALLIDLNNLSQWRPPYNLPTSAVRWLEQEAVPVGVPVDFERETRLTEDFSSFISLWTADDSERGQMARDDKSVGKLVDDAFSSRWRTFANLR